MIAAVSLRPDSTTQLTGPPTPHDRRRDRVGDRIRGAKDTGLRNLPLHELDQNRIWQAIVALACEITAWTELLAPAEHPARRWEPNVSGCGSSPCPPGGPSRPPHQCAAPPRRRAAAPGST
jgi:hypothetical protein